MSQPKQVVVTVNGQAGRCGHEHPDHYSALPCSRMAKRLAREHLPDQHVDVRQMTTQEASSLKTVSEVWGWQIPYHRGRGRPTGPQLPQPAAPSRFTSNGPVGDMLGAADKLCAQAQSSGSDEAVVLYQAAQSMLSHACKLLDSLISEKKSTGQ